MAATQTTQTAQPGAQPGAQPDLFDRFRVIDVDSHITEPPDVWTARVPASMRSKVPSIVRIDGVDTWMADDVRISTPGVVSMAGYDGIIPDYPKTFDEIPASMWDAQARLKHLDDQGIAAQVLYPNVGGFGNGYFLRLGDRELVKACVRAYNDWLIDWTGVAPDRLVPICAVPFWDLDFALEEIGRCLDMGHKAINFCNQPEHFGSPALADRHWDPIWALAQEAGVSVSFHIGGGDIGNLMNDEHNKGWRTNFAQVSAHIFMDNMLCISDLIFAGICHRFPELKFVSVESGVGWIPGVLEAMDWQWRNGGVPEEHPEYELLPSEYFRRQIYGCFWFEQAAARFALEQYPDNILYETDFPHPTCQHPGPKTPARHPREYAADALGGLDDAVLSKVLHDNAAGLYGLS